MREAVREVEAVVMKTDNEPALVKVVEEIARLRAGMGWKRNGGGAQPDLQQQE